MAYSKYKTFISGFNTIEIAPKMPNCLDHDLQLKFTVESDAFMKSHFVQARRAGKLKPETVAKIASKLGIVRDLRAEAVSFDGSGKGRHDHKAIDLAA